MCYTNFYTRSQLVAELEASRVSLTQSLDRITDDLVKTGEILYGGHYMMKKQPKLRKSKFKKSLSKFNCCSVNK